jgi:hypothetical protein
MTVVDVRRAEPGGAADISYVLCLVQASSVLLAAVGEVLLMGGNGAYLALPVAKVGVLLWLATKVVSGRRWAMITLIVVESVTLAGFAAQLLLSLLPAIGLTLNLAGLVSNVVLPAGLIVLCARSMQSRPSVPTVAVPEYPPPQDPFAPAPIVDESTTMRMLAESAEQS